METLTVSRPYYFMLTFWGERYADYFYSLCLPSLLSDNNLPVLKDKPGSKLIICTTAADWDRLKSRPLVERLREFVEPFFIEINPPGKDDPPQLHMSGGHRRAADKAHRDKAIAGFLAPDLILSDGMVATAVEVIESGKTIVLCPALRFAMEPVLERLNSAGLLQVDQPLRLPSQLLSSIAASSLHSEIRRYDFEALTFDDYPIWSYWRVPRRDGIVLYTVSWAMLLGDYGAIPHYEDDFLKESTIDGFYVYKNFGHLCGTDAMAWLTDSADAVFMSLTSEQELYYPLKTIPINKVPLIGVLARLGHIKKFHQSDVLDPFRRYAYAVPIVIHGDAIDAQYERTISESLKRIKLAIRLPLLLSSVALDLDRVVRRTWPLVREARERPTWVISRAIRRAAKPAIILVASALRQLLPDPTYKSIRQVYRSMKQTYIRCFEGRDGGERKKISDDFKRF